MITSTIKALIFDYGNVLGIDPTQAIFSSIKNEFNIEIDEVRKEYKNLTNFLQEDKLSSDKFWHIISNKLGIGNFQKFKEIWIESYKKNSYLNKKMADLLFKLKIRGYKLYLLSNLANIYKNINPVIETLKILDGIIYSFEVKSRKPERKIYETLIQRIKIHPNKCVFIDDNPINLIHPRRMGMKTIRFITFKEFLNQIEQIL